MMPGKPATCIRRTSHLHECGSAQQVQFCVGRFRHSAGRQMAVLLPHGVEHERAVFASVETPCHTHRRNGVCDHAGVHGSLAQICGQMYFHSLDTHMGAAHHGSANGSPDGPHVRKIHHTPHTHEGAHLSGTLHEWPNDASEEMFAHILDKQMAYPGYELEHELQDDVSK